MDLFSTTSGAVLSVCGLFRYSLFRLWDESKPALLLIMVNPSTADHEYNDLTISKSIAIARNLGFGRLNVGNLGAYRCSDPSRLQQVVDPIGPENDMHLETMLATATDVICAWGNECERLPGRAEAVYSMILKAGLSPRAFKLTKHGHPSHPMARGKGYFPTTVQPVPFTLPMPQ